MESRIVPEGGWGWVVVAAVALINMFNQSILSVFGLLFGEHLKSMNEETISAALVTNLNCLAYNFSGFIIGPALKYFTPRNVSFFGCLITASGLLICSISMQLWHIIIGYSFLVGIGLGLIAPSTFMAINDYFNKRKGRAVGVAMAGTGVGQMIIPHIVRILLENYGFQITVMVMAALSLFGLLGSLAFKPFKPEQQTIYNNRKDLKLLLDLKGSYSIDYNGLQESCLEIQIVKDPILSSTPSSPVKKESKIYKNIFHKFAQAMDLELLKDPVFWSIIVGMGLAYTATTNFSMLFPYFLQDSTGISRTHTALCMSVVAGADIVSRLLLPILTEKIQCSYRVVFLFGTVGMLIFRTLLAESEQLSLLIIFSGFFGIMKSATVVNNNLTISEYCKSEKLPGGLGLNMISKGVLVITLGQLLGWLRDYTGSYSLCLHAQNILLILVVIFWLPELLYKFYQNTKLRKRTNKLAEIEVN